MRTEYKDLKNAYVAELRAVRKKSLAWWQDLNRDFDLNPGEFKLTHLWPMGPASHPWVIATVRKYYFLCDQLNKKILAAEKEKSDEEGTSIELSWGRDERPKDIGAPIDPKVFVYDLLSGSKTQDVYEFVQSLVYVPIGILDGRDV
jgi:hypothetical protein